MAVAFAAVVSPRKVIQVADASHKSGRISLVRLTNESPNESPRATADTLLLPLLPDATE